MKKILFLLVLFSFSFAQFQALLDAHYQASKDENWDAYIATFDTSDMDESDIQNMRDAVETVWKNFNTDSFRVSELTYIQDGEGYALLKYNLSLSVSGAESFSSNMEYIALCRLSGSQWKLLYSMPLADYLEFTDSVMEVSNTARAAGIYYDSESREPEGSGLALIDGSPATFSPGTETGDTGMERETRSSDSGGCSTAFILLALLGGLFSIHRQT